MPYTREKTVSENSEVRLSDCALVFKRNISIGNVENKNDIDFNDTFPNTRLSDFYRNEEDWETHFDGENVINSNGFVLDLDENESIPIDGPIKFHDFKGAKQYDALNVDFDGTTNSNLDIYEYLNTTHSSRLLNADIVKFNIPSGTEIVSDDINIGALNIDVDRLNNLIRLDIYTDEYITGKHAVELTAATNESGLNGGNGASASEAGNAIHVKTGSAQSYDDYYINIYQKGKKISGGFGGNGGRGGNAGQQYQASVAYVKSASAVAYVKYVPSVAYRAAIQQTYARSSGYPTFNFWSFLDFGIKVVITYGVAKITQSDSWVLSGYGYSTSTYFFFTGNSNGEWSYTSQGTRVDVSASYYERGNYINNVNTCFNRGQQITTDKWESDAFNADIYYLDYFVADQPYVPAVKAYAGVAYVKSATAVTYVKRNIGQNAINATKGASGTFATARTHNANISNSFETKYTASNTKAADGTAATGESNNASTRGNPGTGGNHTQTASDLNIDKDTLSNKNIFLNIIEI
jgi:hypothetical protein